MNIIFEYYLEKAGGGNPLIIEPSNVIMDGTTTLTRNPRALGQIVANEWDWGDLDSLGFETIYVELPGSADPDDAADPKTMTADFPVKTGEKKLEGVIFGNKGTSNVSIDTMETCWKGGHADQVLKKITDETTDIELYNKDDAVGVVVSHTLDFEFDDNFINETFTLLVNYTSGSSSDSTSVSFLHRTNHPIR